MRAFGIVIVIFNLVALRGENMKIKIQVPHSARHWLKMAG